jgi:hypothetical protein
MSNPFAPPGDTRPSSERGAPEDTGGPGQGRWRAAFDTLLFVVLGLTLVPHVLLNAMLWLGHWQGIGMYDPAIGGDPAWRARSAGVPLAAGCIAAARILVARTRLPIGRGFERAYVAMATVALVTTLVALLPEPSFFGS